MQKLSVIAASVLLSLGSSPLSADEVKLTTGLATGETLAVGTNGDLTVTAAWGDGTTETWVTDGSLKLLTVKHATLTLSTQEPLTSLYVQGNKLTALELTDVPGLRQLYAADNQLTTLDVAAATALEELDLQDNQLNALNASKLASLLTVNVANNQIEASQLKLSSTARLEQYIAAGNQLTALPSTAAMKQARTVWAQHNALKTANLSQSADLRSLCLSGNQLTALTLAEAPLLADVWVENNQLESIDLSKGSPALVSLAADHNQLTQVLWDDKCHSTFSYAYLNNNALFINSMPPAKYTSREILVNSAPMDDYVMDAQVYDLETLYNWSTLIAKNGWGLNTSATYTLTDASGAELVKGTDFTETSKKFKFKVPHAGVVLKVSSSAYSFQTAPFNIGTTEAIQTVAADGTSLSLTTAPGLLQADAPAGCPVRIYSVSGACVVSGRLAAGRHSWQLPAGIYLVNGTKVLVP